MGTRLESRSAAKNGRPTVLFGHGVKGGGMRFYDAILGSGFVSIDYVTKINRLPL
jgi:hypothetical protein